MHWIQYLTFLAIIIFLIMVIRRIIRIQSAPIHFRWELYPVPHEKGKASYGGSRMEEPEWWTKRSEKSHFAEAFYMFKEIVFLKGVWENNRNLWLGSFFMHFALYMLIVNIFITLIAMVFQLAGSAVSQESTGITMILYYLIYWIALVSSVLGILGSIRLLFQRIVDQNLSLFSSPSHYFNLVFIGAIFLTEFFWIIGSENFVGQAVDSYTAIFTFSALPELPASAMATFTISLLFMIYLPFTHMTHFFTKYFTYHKIRWEDEPNLPGSKLQDKINSQLNQVVSWSAPHIGADGSKTWLVIATTNPWEKKDDKEA